MIEIEASLLSQSALDTLIEEVVLRNISSSIEEPQVEAQKYKLKKQIQHGQAVIVYDAKTHFCDIVNAYELGLV